MKKLNFTQRWIGLLAIVAIVAISACKKSENIEDQNARATLRLTNSFEGSTGQDFYQGNTKLSTSAILYGGSTAKVTAVANVASNLAFTNTGTTNVSAIITAGLVADATYTLFYNKRPEGVGEIVGFAEDNSAPAAGKIKIRFVNLGGTLSGAVNVALAAGGSLASGITLGSATSYQTIDAGVDLTATSVGGINVNIPGTNFTAGKNYTVWFDNSLATTVRFHVIEQN